MKKIGILTACRTNNNGTDLQTLAMQNLFSEYFDTEIVNYKCEKLERSHKLLLRFSIVDVLRIPHRFFMNLSHGNFRRRLFRFSKRKYDKTTVREIDNIYDMVVVGSDQIWNMEITGYDLNFFLPWKNFFAMKWAYAPSLGVDDITNWENDYQISTYLRDFKKITVREADGVVALQKIGIESKEVLDPLLAVNPELWASFKKPYRGKPYILFYQVATSVKDASAAIEYARNKGWDVIYILPPSRPIRGIKMRSFVSVERWLQYVQNAEMIVTDSYHGLSICVSAHKNFRLVLMSQKSRNIRSLNLLNNIGCEDFILDKINMETVPNWEDVETVLEAKRKEAHEYIRQIAQEEDGTCLNQ